MNNIKFLKELKKTTPKEAGGKGYSLSYLLNNGYSVPNGFVVLSSVYDLFIKDNNLSKKIDACLKKTNLNDIKTITKASKDIQKLFIETKLPINLEEEIINTYKKLNSKYVAIRSSATVEDSIKDSWAGQLDTFLGTTEDNLIINIKKCWGSLYNSRAIFYRLHKKINKNVAVAVVVQEMIDSDVSGIAFSLNPVTNNKNEIIIEAGYGLGESIVSGQITPDMYVVSKNKKILNKIVTKQTKKLSRDGTKIFWTKIINKNVNLQKLSDNQIIEISKTIINLEKDYNCPVDVEWTIKNSKIYVLQVRPITTN